MVSCRNRMRLHPHTNKQLALLFPVKLTTFLLHKVLVLDPFPSTAHQLSPNKLSHMSSPLGLTVHTWSVPAATETSIPKREAVPVSLHGCPVSWSHYLAVGSDVVSSRAASTNAWMSIIIVRIAMRIWDDMEEFNRKMKTHRETKLREMKQRIFLFYKFKQLNWNLWTHFLSVIANAALFEI